MNQLIRNPFNANDVWLTDFIHRRACPPDEVSFWVNITGADVIDWPWFFYIRPA